MKTWLVAVLVGVMLASVACAQWTPRSLAMGSTAVGVADDGAAWFQNPAGLAALHVKCTEGQPWAADAIAGWGEFEDDNAGGITASGWDAARGFGVGAGYGDINNLGRAYGLGVGASINQTPLSVGLSYVRNHRFGDNDFNFLNVGLMYRFEQPCKDPLRLGVLVRDVFNDSDEGPFVDLGIAWPVTQNLLFAADVVDLTDQIDLETNVGLEYKFGLTQGLVLRAGLQDTPTDTNLCLGAGWKLNQDWRIDAAWVNADPDNTIAVAAAYSY